MTESEAVAQFLLKIVPTLPEVIVGDVATSILEGREQFLNMMKILITAGHVLVTDGGERYLKPVDIAACHELRRQMRESAIWE